MAHDEGEGREERGETRGWFGLWCLMVGGESEHDANQVLSESYSQGILSGLVVSRALDSYLRLQSLGLNTSSALSTTFGYGDDGRLQTVTGVLWREKPCPDE
jgi:hypothetical protein